MLHIVTAANSGIGLAFAKLLLSKFPEDQFIFTHRQDAELQELQVIKERFSDKVHFHILEATKEEDFEKLSLLIKSINEPIGFLINTIGLLEGEILESPERKIAECQPEKMLHSFQVNALPSLLLAKYLFPQLRSSKDLKFASLSAKVGSITDNRSGGWYSYRMSKVALNMAIKNLAIEIGRYNPSALVVSLHPGTTETNFTKNFLESARNKYEIHSPEATAENLFRVLSSLDVKDSGNFYNWTGEALAF